MEIREAEERDLNPIMEIIAQAKAYFRANDIPQWQGEYPSTDDIRNDLGHGGTVAEENGKVIAYCMIAPMIDPNYAYIEGAWYNDRPYIVMHRTCVADTCKGRGVGRLFTQYAVKKALDLGIRDLRADTHEVNVSMQKMLEKDGFVHCGTIYVSDGSPRYAYHLVLDER
ncbi:MAG: GNAT family N-acetyltransferase [Bulleidia sp.]